MKIKNKSTCLFTESAGLGLLFAGEEDGGGASKTPESRKAVTAFFPYLRDIVISLLCSRSLRMSFSLSEIIWAP